MQYVSITIKQSVRRKHSCTYAIAHMTELMRQAIDKKSTGQECFLDLKKAFDSLDHSILLRKGYNLGFRGPIFELLESYSGSRCQYVKNDLPEMISLKYVEVTLI